MLLIRHTISKRVWIISYIYITKSSSIFVSINEMYKLRDTLYVCESYTNTSTSSSSIMFLKVNCELYLKSSGRDGIKFGEIDVGPSGA